MTTEKTPRYVILAVSWGVFAASLKAIQPRRDETLRAAAIRELVGKGEEVLLLNFTREVPECAAVKENGTGFFSSTGKLCRLATGCKFCWPD